MPADGFWQNLRPTTPETSSFCLARLMRSLRCSRGGLNEKRLSRGILESEALPFQPGSYSPSHSPPWRAINRSIFHIVIFLSPLIISCQGDCTYRAMRWLMDTSTAALGSKIEQRSLWRRETDAETGRSILKVRKCNVALMTFPFLLNDVIDGKVHVRPCRGNILPFQSMVRAGLFR